MRFFRFTFTGFGSINAWARILSFIKSDLDFSSGSYVFVCVLLLFLFEGQLSHYGFFFVSFEQMYNDNTPRVVMVLLQETTQRKLGLLQENRIMTVKN